MPTKKGSGALEEAMVRKYGSYEAWQQVQAENGRRGGSAKVKKGFAMDRDKASEAGKVGGKAAGYSRSKPRKR